MLPTIARWFCRRSKTSRLLAQITSFRSHNRGNVAIMFALASLPVIAAVGCVIDYSFASAVKTKLQAAADAAALATVSVKSSALTTAGGMSGNGTVSGGSTLATGFFNANLASSPENIGYTNLSPSATVTKTGSTVTAAVSFTAKVPTFFMGVLGHSNMAISGTSTASYAMPTYINFYLMLDVSGSMSFPSTTAEQLRLMAVNPDNLTGSMGYSGGCQFACHFSQQGACQQTGQPGWDVGQGPIPAVGQSSNPSPGGYCQGFLISRVGTSPVSFASGTTNTTNGSYVNWNNTPVTSCSSAGTSSCIQLRADAVGYAVNDLLQTAAKTEQSTGISNQFQVGLYPFIVNLYSYVALTSNISGSTITSAAGNLASLLDNGGTGTAGSSLGSGGTHFENALSSMNSIITSVGTGASSSSGLPYVFLITDGSQDCQTQSGGTWGGTGTSCSPYYNSATTLDPSYCSTLKTRGITVAVLYIPYQPIADPNSSFANNEDGYANSNIANIPGVLQSCASPNFFYTANSPADIDAMLVTMFQQAVNTAHITN